MGILQRIIRLFQESFEQLQVDVSPETLEKLAILVHTSMAADSRRFHRPEHVFMLAEGSDPARTLAALFHDIVYYQVDEDFIPEICRIITPYIQEKETTVYLAAAVPSDDRCFHLTREVFGFEQGRKLPPFGGMNEFLSALVMNSVLGPLLPEALLLQLTVYVEATIPFRGPNAQGESFADVMKHRIEQIAQTDALPIDPDTAESMMQSAVLFANTDVQGFAEPDPGIFLDNTWKLLPESNRSLRSAELYSIRDYRRAIQSTERFLGGLDPELVFHRYKGVPSDEEFQRMTGQARANIRIATEYLAVKVVSMAILEALAEATGGNGPRSLFVEDFDRPEDTIALPPGLERSGAFEPASPVFMLLDRGRTSEIDFDIRRSPLSAFLYEYQDAAAIQQLLTLAKTMFDGQLSSQDFLAHVNPKILSVIAQKCAQTAITRREQLQQYIRVS